MGEAESPLNEYQTERLAQYVHLQTMGFEHEQIVFIFGDEDPPEFEGSIHGETVAMPYNYVDTEAKKPHGPAFRIPRAGV